MNDSVVQIKEGLRVINEKVAKLQELRKEKLNQTGKVTFFEYLEMNYPSYDDLALDGMGLSLETTDYATVESKLYGLLKEKGLNTTVDERTPEFWSSLVSEAGRSLGGNK